MLTYPTPTEPPALPESDALLEALVMFGCPREARQVLRSYLDGKTTFATFQQQWIPYAQSTHVYLNRQLDYMLRNGPLVALLPSQPATDGTLSLPGGRQAQVPALFQSQGEPPPPLPANLTRLLAIYLHAFADNPGGELLFTVAQAYQLPPVVAALGAEGMDEVLIVAQFLNAMWRLSLPLSDAIVGFILRYSSPQLVQMLQHLWHGARHTVAHHLLPVLSTIKPLPAETIATVLPYSSASRMHNYLHALLSADWEHFAGFMEHMIHSGQSSINGYLPYYLGVLLERDPAGNSALAAGLCLRTDIGWSQRYDIVQVLHQYAPDRYYTVLESALFLNELRLLEQSFHLLRTDTSPRAQAILHYGNLHLSQSL